MHTKRRNATWLTAAGREKLRQAALTQKPWLHSTGPRTPEGKAKVGLNAKKRTAGVISAKQMRRELQTIYQSATGLVACRQMLRDERRSS
jgi:hypothetical protein